MRYADFCRQPTAHRSLRSDLWLEPLGSQMHVHTCQQLTDAEGFPDEIDGTEFEATHDVFFGREGRHHDHRHVLAVVGPALQDLDTQQSGHHLVEQDQVEIVGETHLERFETVVYRGDLGSNALETAGDEQGHNAVVFGNKDLCSTHNRYRTLAHGPGVEVTVPVPAW